jgi:Chs5-Arf1p-binding protein BUD7/BCH1
MSLDSPKNIPEYVPNCLFCVWFRHRLLTGGALRRFIETEIEECLRSRTDQLPQFRDLGPPDLVHYRRGNGSKEVIAHQQEERGCSHGGVGWSVPLCRWGGWLVVCFSGSLSPGPAICPSPTVDNSIGDVLVQCGFEANFESSCYNAFSRVDMRVEVKIPGGVKAHVIDERGNKSLPPN